MNTLTFYKDRDNAEIVQLLEDGVAIDMGAVTKVAVYFHGVLYDSTAYATAFDYTLGAGKLKLMLGKISGIPARTDGKAEIVIFDTSNTLGIVWGTIRIKMIDFDG